VLGRARWRPRRSGMVVRALGETDEVCVRETPQAQPSPSKLPMDEWDVRAGHSRSWGDRAPESYSTTPPSVGSGLAPVSAAAGAETDTHI
jgi:hypothetical protein